MSEAGHPANAPHETRDVHRRGLIIFACAFAGIIAACVGVLWLLFGAGREDIAAATRIEAPPPAGELAQRQQLATYLATQRAELESLGWRDAAHTRAKIPIEDAMAILAGRGPKP
jgi:hypothetical protein